MCNVPNRQNRISIYPKSHFIKTYSFSLVFFLTANAGHETENPAMITERSKTITSIYVHNPNYRSRNSDKSHDFTDITAALDFAKKINGDVSIYIDPGLYKIYSTLMIKSSGNMLKVQPSSKSKVILDGQNITDTAMLLHGGPIKIIGLTIQNFNQTGIAMQAVKDSEIYDNIIRNINSSRWNTAGIYGLHLINNVNISNNYVENTGFGGIVFESSSQGAISNVVISGNKIINSCIKVKDCGAIYINGRSLNSKNISINNNYIYNFGMQNAQSKGIYLDDGLGDVSIKNNTIDGNGDFAVQIHGGGGNMFQGNNFKTTRPLLVYQGLSTLPENGKRPNYFVNNKYSNKIIAKRGQNLPEIIIK